MKATSADSIAASEPAPPADTRAERARAAVATFKGSLKQALTTAINDQGLAGAIDVCAREAPRLADAGSQGGLRIGRATRKPRNPANAATGWQADALATYEAMRPELRAAHVYTRDLPDGALAYAEPLSAEGLCLACHGKTLAPEVTLALSSRYPEDQATGYAAGDLRGVVWAEVR